MKCSATSLCKPIAVITFVLLTLLPLILTIQLANANPSAKEPMAPLAAHGTIPEAKQMVSSLYSKMPAWDKLTDQLIQLANSGKMERFPAREMAAAAEQLFIARRDILHLQLMGEPAAVDLMRRLDYSRGHVIHYGRQYGQTQLGNAFKQKYIKQFQKDAPRWAKQQQQVVSLIEAGNFEQANSLAEKMGTERVMIEAFGSLQERDTYWDRSFDIPTMALSDSRLTPFRSKKYREMAQQRVTEQLATIDAFEEATSQLANNLKTAGSTSLSEGQSGGPVEAFKFVGDQWSKTHAALIRAFAISNTFRLRDQNVAEHSQRLHAAAKSVLLGIIDAAADSTTEDSAMQVYAQLLAEIATLDRRCKGSDLATSCRPSLDRYLTRHSTLADKVKAYERGTSEVLRMRREFTQQRAKYLLQSFPTVTSLVDSKTDSTPPMIIAPKELGLTAAKTVLSTSEQILNRTVSCSPVLRITPASPVGIGPFRDHCYVNTTPVAAAKERESLQKSLVVSADHPALTLEAADAMTSAESLEYLNVGGSLANVHLEAYQTRFVSLPDVASVICPLGTLPVLSDRAGSEQTICWRFDLTPQWFQHKYFIVNVNAQ